MQYNVPIPQDQESESSSDPSDTTEEEPSIKPEESDDPDDPKISSGSTSRPETPSSCSSESDSFDSYTEHINDRNYLSEDTDSEVEAPSAYIDINLEMQEILPPKPVRQSGADFKFIEKKFVPTIFIPFKPTPKPLVPPIPGVIEPEKKKDDPERKRLSLIIFMQSRIRSYLRYIRLRHTEYYGTIVKGFYLHVE